MNAEKIVKGLRWLSENDEWVFTAETMAKAADIIESLQAQLAKEKRRADRAEKVLELIKRDINEQDKIYIHIADYFGRGIYIDEDGENETTVAYFTLCKDNELGYVYKCASCGNEMYGYIPKYCSECGKRIVEGDAE
jgi:rubrerythrin